MSVGTGGLFGRTAGDRRVVQTDRTGGANAPAVRLFTHVLSMRDGQVIDGQRSGTGMIDYAVVVIAGDRHRAHCGAYKRKACLRNG